MMPHAPQMPPDLREGLARQLGERLSPVALRAFSDGQRVEIGESFPVWMLGLDRIGQVAPKLRPVAADTGLWHHQVRHGSTAPEFARSMREPNVGAWQLVEVATSELAAKIDEAIAWVDQNVGDAANPADDPVVHLLAVPAYYLTALWLEGQGEDNVVVVHRPEQYHQLEYRRLYPAGEFLARLSQEKPAEGIPRQAPR
jgi:hypothetical protein